MVLYSTKANNTDKKLILEDIKTNIFSSFYCLHCGCLISLGMKLTNSVVSSEVDLWSCCCIAPQLNFVVVVK
jgi:hypothetical protein